MLVTLDHNQELALPPGHRWVEKGELRQAGDRFAYNGEWVEIDGWFGRRQLDRHELVRKES